MTGDRKSTRLNSSHTIISYDWRSEEHTSELQSHDNLVCRLLLEKKRSRAGSASCWWRDRRGAGGRRDVCGSGPCAAIARAEQPTRLAAFAAVPVFFFLKDPAPPEIYPFPPQGPFRT